MAQSKGQQRRERQRREALQAQKAQERFIAQQQREAERQEREAKRAEAQADRDRKAQYLGERIAEAEELTTAVATRAATLAAVLLTGLKRQAPLDFRSMRLTFAANTWAPGNLANAEKAPRWEGFAPPEPGLLSRVFGGDARHSEAVQQARLRFEQEQAATCSEKRTVSLNWSNSVSNMPGVRMSGSGMPTSTTYRSMRYSRHSGKVIKRPSSDAFDSHWRRHLCPMAFLAKRRSDTGRIAGRPWSSANCRTRTSSQLRLGSGTSKSVTRLSRRLESLLKFGSGTPI
ncbi:hypothetical protein [Amycolatopsis magusensis]|uniref:hypothetical protein n=1 Tax=Amycolatopsis magusensis TaxID=882444 RepID=UPI00378FF843